MPKVPGLYTGKTCGTCRSESDDGSPDRARCRCKLQYIRDVIEGAGLPARDNDRQEMERGEMKAIIILLALLGLLAFGFVVMTATPNDQEEYEAYMKWKERQKRHGKTD